MISFYSADGVRADADDVLLCRSPWDSRGQSELCRCRPGALGPPDLPQVLWSAFSLVITYTFVLRVVSHVDVFKVAALPMFHISQRSGSTLRKTNAVPTLQ